MIPQLCSETPTLGTPRGRSNYVCIYTKKGCKSSSKTSLPHKTCNLESDTRCNNGERRAFLHTTNMHYGYLAYIIYLGVICRMLQKQNITDTFIHNFALKSTFLTPQAKVQSPYGNIMSHRLNSVEEDPVCLVMSMGLHHQSMMPIS